MTTTDKMRVVSERQRRRILRALKTGETSELDPLMTVRELGVFLAKRPMTSEEQGTQTRTPDARAAKGLRRK